MERSPIQKWLFAQQDLSFRDFHAKLVPTLDKETIIGVRTPMLRAYAKELLREGSADAFLEELPHRYFEENQLHAFLLSECKDYEELMLRLEKFLPYIDNWATCDQLRPKVFKKHRDKLKKCADAWLMRSDEPYAVRYAVGMYHSYFLDDGFDPADLEKLAGIQSEEYYVNMMLAWYYATALTKQYEASVPILEGKRLAIWVHNKAIQKAIESRQISDERKTYLRSLKRKTA